MFFLKGTVIVFLSDPHFKMAMLDSHWYPLYLYLINNLEDINVFKVFNFGFLLYNIVCTAELRKSLN